MTPEVKQHITQVTIKHVHERVTPEQLEHACALEWREANLFFVKLDHRLLPDIFLELQQTYGFDQTCDLLFEATKSAHEARYVR